MENVCSGDFCSPGQSRVLSSSLPNIIMYVRRHGARPATLSVHGNSSRIRDEDEVNAVVDGVKY